MLHKYVPDMSVSPAEDDTIALRDYLTVLWRHRALVAVVTVAITLAGVVFTARLPQVFESETVIRLRIFEIRGTSPFPFLDASPMVGAISTPSFIEGAARDARMQAPTGSLMRAVHVGTMSDARMVWVRVRHADPALARRLNGALVQAFISQVSSEVRPKREAIGARLREVEAQRSETELILQQSRQLLREPARSAGGSVDAFTRSFALNAISTAGAVLQRLSEERRGLELELLAFALPAVVTGPTMPAEPVGPPRARNVILAGLLGGAVAVAAAFAVEYVRPSRVPAAIAAVATVGRRGREIR